MKNTKNKFGQFYGILSRMHGADKEEIIWEYSNMLTTSVSEFAAMNPRAYKEMLIDLEAKFPAEKPSKEVALREQKRLRSAILHRLQQHGVDTTNWGTVNDFLSSDKIAGKRLYEMTNEEMVELIKKLEKILLKDATKRAKINHLMQNN